MTRIPANPFHFWNPHFLPFPFLGVNSAHEDATPLLGQNSAAKVQVGRGGPPSFQIDRPVSAPEDGDACPLGLAEQNTTVQPESV
ncbi:hypothetical protein [Deinococcus sp.]|uniref:hypothetical protein n=1 Tax=Deinococcus sp. TaxID=47478 RepID=UPI00286DE54B|nr:hypothetical protein [Deinococcus sp.]